MIKKSIYLITLPLLFLLSILEIYIGTNIFYYMVLVAVGALTIVEMLKKPGIYFSKLNILITFSFLTSALVTAYENIWDLPYKYKHFLMYVIYTLNVFFVYIIAYYAYVNYKEEMRNAIWVMSLVIFVSAIMAYPEFIYYTFFTVIGYEYRVFSFLYNPIPAAAIWLMGIWIPLYRKNKRIDMLLKLVYLPPIMFGQCRSAWLGMFIVYIIYFVNYREEILGEIRRINKKIIAFCAALAVVILAAISPLAINLVIPRLSNITQGEGYYIRRNYFIYTLQQTFSSGFKRILLGHGLNSSSDMILHSPVYDYYPLCDNAYLTVLYEEGLISLIMVGVIIAITFVMLRRKVEKPYVLALISSFITSYFYDVQKIETPVLLIAIFAAIVCVNFDETRMKKVDIL